MSLIFYFAPMSTASITEAVLAELGTPHEVVQVTIGEGTRAPAFLAINPNGRVPAIVHDGTAIWESCAITMYLGEAFGVEAGLYPPPGPARGEAMKWIAWGNIALAEAGSRLMTTLPPGAPGGAGPGAEDAGAAAPGAGAAKAGAKARGDIAAHLAVLEGALAGRPFLLGAYGLADTHVQGIVGWLGMMGTDLAPFPAVRGWLGRCAERPALKALMGG